MSRAEAQRDFDTKGQKGQKEQKIVFVACVSFVLLCLFPVGALFSLFAWGLQLHYGDAGATHAHVFVAEGADAGHGGEVLADVLA